MTPFLAQIEIFSFNFAPKGWAQCNGQLLPINQNQPLFSLLGTTFGGDGRVNFGLPDLRSRVPISFSSNYILGQPGGEENVLLNISSMAQHTHTLFGNSASGTASAPATNTLLAKSSGTSSTGSGFNVSLYSSAAPNSTQYAGAITNTGGGQAHPNIMPYLTLNICIALQGIFPSRN